MSKKSTDSKCCEFKVRCKPNETGSGCICSIECKCNDEKDCCTTDSKCCEFKVRCKPNETGSGCICSIECKCNDETV